MYLSLGYKSQSNVVKSPDWYLRYVYIGVTDSYKLCLNIPHAIKMIATYILVTQP